MAGRFLDFPCSTIVSRDIKIALLKGLLNPEERGKSCRDSG